MSSTQVHLAALFETAAAAHAARDALIAAGVDGARILVLDRDNRDSGVQQKVGLWGTLKRWLIPDAHAHHYAEGISRGHPLLVADVEQEQHDVAVATLAAAHPLDVEDRAAGWIDAGWSGTHASQAAWLDASDEEREAPGNAGIRSGGYVTGDYGAVGAPLGGDVADTDIERDTRVRSYFIG